MINTNDARYEFNTFDVYSKADLKGYINGYIAFNYNNDEYNHEFLYRFDDADNGDNYKLVSIDYGYKIPFVEEVWGDIEKLLTEYISR